MGTGGFLFIGSNPRGFNLRSYGCVVIGCSACWLTLSAEALKEAGEVNAPTMHKSILDYPPFFLLIVFLGNLCTRII
jgi:hypothetical protein